MTKTPTEYICPDCHTEIGKFHDPGCDMEECPFCRGQLISCNCCYKHLGLNPEQDMSEEQEKKWHKITQKKGSIPYGSETRYA